MWSYVVVPVLVGFYGWEGITIPFIRVEKPLYFAVALRVLYTAQDLPYAVLFKPFFEVVLPSYVCY